MEGWVGIFFAPAQENLARPVRMRKNTHTRRKERSDVLSLSKLNKTKQGESCLVLSHIHTGWASEYVYEHTDLPRKDAEVVHVTVCIIVLWKAQRKPDDLGKAQSCTQDSFDVLLLEPTVSVGVEQALLGGDQGALAIANDAPTF